MNDPMDTHEILDPGEILYHGKKFDVLRAVTAGRNGAKVERVVVRHPGSVVILPVLDSAGASPVDSAGASPVGEPGKGPQVVAILNRRYSLGRDLLELPAGTNEYKEEPLACAHRELIEETGYKAGRMEYLGRFYTSPGMTDELMHAFVARDLSFVGQALEADEEIRVRPIGVGEALAMVDRGEIEDAKSVLCLLWARARGMLGVERT
jgi:ADP-ribose pyrophosphatase